ncbi:MAG: hypothetical protein Q4E12_05340 [Coriobacteriia bacterium]|nr:hypothetical protein [Coriobacteriia bacterium]
MKESTRFKAESPALSQAISNPPTGYAACTGVIDTVMAKGLRDSNSTYQPLRECVIVTRSSRPADNGLLMLSEMRNPHAAQYFAWDGHKLHQMSNSYALDMVKNHQGIEAALSAMFK